MQQHPNHWTDGAHCASELLADQPQPSPDGLMLTALLAFLALLVWSPTTQGAL